jgi:hypothetical protein
MRKDVVKKLYELSASGDFDGQRPLLTDGYRHHILGQGIDLEGADAAIEANRDAMTALKMTWFSDRIEEHGPFVVSFSTGQIEGLPPFKALNVYRFEGDLIAEGWVLAAQPGQ